MQMTESNSSFSATLSLRVKTLASELPIDIPASATVLQLKRRIAQHLELEQPSSKQLKLMRMRQDIETDGGTTNPVLLIDIDQLDHSFVTDGAELILTIEDLPQIDEVSSMAMIEAQSEK
jgi:hypothetical protein